MLGDSVFRERNQSTVNQSPLSQFSFDAVEAYAVTTAQQLGFRLGSLRRMTRWDAETIRAYWTFDVTEYVGELEYSADYSGRDAPFDLSEPLEDIEFYEVFYPVYYQGLRLYSGVSPALPGEAIIEDLSLHIMYDVQGISLLKYPVFGGFKKTGKEAALIDARDAIALLRNTYANMFLPGVKQITLQSVSMDYTPFTGDLLAKKGYTLYPMWNMRCVMEYEDGTRSLTYNGFHAATGKQIY